MAVQQPTNLKHLLISFKDWFFLFLRTMQFKKYSLLQVVSKPCTPFLYSLVHARWTFSPKNSSACLVPTKHKWNVHCSSRCSNKPSFKIESCKIQARRRPPDQTNVQRLTKLIWYKTAAYERLTTLTFHGRPNSAYVARNFSELNWEKRFV